METATIPKEDFHSATNEGNSDPATYGGGYQPLLQEDPETSFTHGERNTAPQQPIVIPPYTPGPQNSQYTPAPHTFNPQQQSSSVRKIRRHFHPTTSTTAYDCSSTTYCPIYSFPHFPCQLHNYEGLRNQ